MLKVIVLLSLVPLVFGHGMVLNPVNRASRWRVDPTAPANYDDNELFCGGITVQWQQNDGKCGLCGDNYAHATPRRHELGGTFGQGVIVESYTSGSIMPVDVRITANHLGHFEFELCDMDTYKVESEECFNSFPLTFTTGETKHFIDRTIGFHNVTLEIPEKIQCEHCILRWTYITGNFWGPCEDGSMGMGCGPQEHYKTCSDIKIVSSNNILDK